MEMILLECEERMEQCIKNLESSLRQVRTGRATAALVDGIEVDYYGAPTPLNQMSAVSVQEGKTVVVKPYDASMLKEVEKAINMANLGISPNNDGKVIRLTVPALTEDVRRDMCKKVSKFAEEAKVAVRNVRRDANDDIKKNKEFTEDEQKGGLEEVQKLTDAMVKKIDAVAEGKEKEVMTI